MESLALGLRILSIFSFLLLIAGLFRPWTVLWWENTQTRLKVLKIYGFASVVSWLLNELIQTIDILN